VGAWVGGAARQFLHTYIDPCLHTYIDPVASLGGVMIDQSEDGRPIYRPDIWRRIGGRNFFVTSPFSGKTPESTILTLYAVG